MDGTLLDLYFDNQVWNERLPLRVAERAGMSTPQARAHVNATLASARGTLTWYCMEHWSRVFEIEVSTIEDELRELIRMRPGCEAFLAFVRARGIRLVLATNAHPQSLERKLAVTGIGSYFDDIVSAHEFGYAKEQAEFWHALQARSGLVGERTLFIDDNLAVLAAARSYGIRYLFGVAWPDSGAGRVEHEDFYCLEHFSDLGCELEAN